MLRIRLRHRRRLNSGSSISIQTPARASIQWTSFEDPDSAPGVPGSGLRDSEVRYKIDDGPFSAWTSTSEDLVEVPGVVVGSVVGLEARSRDAAGNASAVTTSLVTFNRLLEDPDVTADAAEWYAAEYGTTASIAQAWLATQDRAENVGQEIADSASGPGYGGVWFDNVARRLNVGLINGQSSAPVMDILAARGLTAATDVRRVAHTQKELEDAQPSLENELTSLIDDGLAVLSRRTSENALHVRIAASASAGDRATIASAVSRASVRVITTDATEASLTVDPLACKFPHCSPPIRGGILISGVRLSQDVTRDSSYNCTSGFNVKNASGDPFVMTAGHCLDADNFGNSDSKWYAFDPIFGGGVLREGLIGQGVKPYYYGEAGDAGLIKVNSNSIWASDFGPLVFITRSNSGSTRRKTNYPIRGSAFNVEKRIVCNSGAVNGSRCGEIRDLNVSVKYGAGLFGVGGRRVKHLGELKSCGVARGDSGGPIVKRGVAYGMISGGSNNGSCRVYFQGVKTAERLLGVNVVRR